MTNNNFTKFPARTARVETTSTIFENIADSLPASFDDAAKTLDEVTITNPSAVDAFFVSKDKAVTPELGEHVVIAAAGSREFKKLDLSTCYFANAVTYTGIEESQSESQSESEPEATVLEIVGTPAER